MRGSLVRVQQDSLFRVMKHYILLTCLICSAFLLIYSFQINKWDKYYANKIYQSPQELIVKAAYYFQNPGFAIDIGCGAGNEAIYLIARGWKVLAIDCEASATKIVSDRKDIASHERLATLTASFNHNLNWDQLPEADFIYASNALPFCHPAEFARVWNHIKAKLVPGGRFAGHFFGPCYQGFSNKDRKEMTFLALEEVNVLFDGFTIEYLNEIEQDDVSGTGIPVHAHIIEVIATKKNE